MGGGSKSKSESYSGSGQLWARPYARQAVQSVQGVFNANQPGLQKLTDIAQGQLVPSLLNQFKAGGDVNAQAQGYNSDVLSGKYMNGNPYISKILEQLDRGVSDQVNSQFENSGRYGSGAQANVLSRNLADANSNVLYQNYSDEMNRMGQAADSAQRGNVAGAGLLQAALGTGAQLPYMGSNSLADSLGALFSGGTEKSTQKGQDPIWGAIGAGLGAAGAAFSDRRLKTKIKKVGEFADGLGMYEFAYKSNPNQMFKGVMADEVKQLRPQAYIENYRGSGYDGVNYGAL
jgi:hypothetical protein